jgi:hypothetical protein
MHVFMIHVHHSARLNQNQPEAASLHMHGSGFLQTLQPEMVELPFMKHDQEFQGKLGT